MYPRIIQKFDNFLVKIIYKYANRKWYKSPLTKELKGDSKSYLEIAEKAKSVQYPIIDQFEKENKFKIDIAFFHELALHTQVGIKKSDICYQHGRLLYSSLRKYIERNNTSNINILESGTAKGFSAVILAKALEDSGISGKIFTFDVLPHNHKMYWNTINDTSGKKSRQQLLENYNNLIEKYIVFHQGNTKTELNRTFIPRIHFAFLDAAHDYYHLISEFKYLQNKQQKGDIIFFDDYTPLKFPGVVKAVDEICKNYKYSKKAIKINDARAYVIAKKL